MRSFPLKIGQVTLQYLSSSKYRLLYLHSVFLHCKCLQVSLIILCRISIISVSKQFKQHRTLQHWKVLTFSQIMKKWDIYIHTYRYTLHRELLMKQNKWVTLFLKVYYCENTCPLMGRKTRLSVSRSCSIFIVY